MNDKKRRALNTFSPVKKQYIIEMHFENPKDFGTVIQRQPHRIAKIEQPLARFSPRRDIYVYLPT